MIVMVENEQVTGTLPSRERMNRERFGAEKAGEIPNTPSEYEREDSSVKNMVSAADGRRERESQRSHRQTTAKINGYHPESGPGSNSRSQPPQLNGEAGRAYADFMRGQQQPNGNQGPVQTQSPYSHRINEDHYYQSQQRSQPRREQPVIGPGKVMSTESDGEEDGMMGQGGGIDGDAFLDGSGSPRIRGGGLNGERV